jgi:hypothetical protein
MRRSRAVLDDLEHVAVLGEQRVLDSGGGRSFALGSGQIMCSRHGRRRALDLG